MTMTDEQVRKGAAAVRDHLLHCLQPLTLPADSHIERAFVLGVQAALAGAGAVAWRRDAEDLLQRLRTMQPPNVILQQITMLGQARDILMAALAEPNPQDHPAPVAVGVDEVSAWVSFADDAPPLKQWLFALSPLTGNVYPLWVLESDNDLADHYTHWCRANIPTIPAALEAKPHA
jgi:hypothetical protein